MANTDPILTAESTVDRGCWNKGTLQVDGDFVLPVTENDFTNPDLRVSGKLKYNINDNVPEYYDGERWLKFLTQSTTFELLNQGNTLKVRVPFTETEDVMMNMTRNVTKNGCYDFATVFAIPTATPLISATGYQLQGASGDDSCPVLTNGMYLGGNHGCTGLRIVTATGHGKDLSDVGSVWIDGASRNFYLLKVVDVNTLWMISQNIHPSDGYSFVNITGNLTYVSGATHTGNITVGGQVTDQLYPGIKNLSQSITMDGLDATSLGSYVGSKLIFNESYDIIDTPDMVNKLVANRPVGGYTVQPNFLDGNTLITIKNTYEYVNNGFLIYSDLTAVKQNRFFSFGGTQAGYIKPAWTTDYKRYVPNTTTLNGYDYRIPTSITSAPPLTNDYIQSTWENSIAPFRVIDQITDGTNTINFSMGYLPKGVGVNREDYVNNALQLFVTRKTYPLALTGDKVNDLNAGASLSAGSSFSISSFKQWSKPQAGTTNTNLVDSGDKSYLFIDAHSTGSGNITIPSEYVGKNIRVLLKSTDFNLYSDIVQSTIDYNVTALNNGYSYVFAEISNDQSLQISDINGLQDELDSLSDGLNDKVTKGGDPTTFNVGTTSAALWGMIYNGTLQAQVGSIGLSIPNDKFLYNQFSANYFRINMGNGTTPGYFGRNEANAITAVDVINQHTSSTGDIINFKSNISNVIATRSGIHKDGRGFGADATAANDWVTKQQHDLKANLASPVFTGNPTAPTPTVGDNDTSIATTAFVTTAITNATGIKTTATTSTNVIVTPATFTSYRLNAGVTTVTLPVLTGNAGVILFFINNSGVNVTVNSNAGGNDIWSGGATVNTESITAGTIMRILHDGTTWSIL